MEQFLRRETKIAVLMAAVACLFSPGASADETVGEARPRVELEPAVIDFGEVFDDGTMQQDILVRNVGSDDLIISKVAVSCPRCLDIMLEPRRVPAGATAVLTVSFDSRGFDGAIQKYVVLQTNDPEMPNIGIEVLARVSPRFFVRGGPVFFQRAETSVAQAWEVTVYSPEPLRAPLERVASDHPAFTGEVEAGLDKNSFRVTVSTVPPVPEGITGANLRISSGDPADPVCMLKVAANVTPSFYVYPSKLLFDTRSGEQLRIIFIDQLPESGVSLQEVRVPERGFRYEVFPGATPFNYRISVYTTGLMGNVGEVGHVVLLTDSEDERYREISIPLVVSDEPLIPVTSGLPCYDVQ